MIDCPNCETNEAVILENRIDYYNYTQYHYYCDLCGFFTREARTPELALSNWNTELENMK